MSALTPRLRHRITFQEQTSERDSDGVLQVSWSTVELDSDTELSDVPAEVLTGPGRESVMSGQVNADIVARITCRWFPGLKQSWRILWDDQVLNIHTIDTDMTGRREWRIKCAAGLNDGQ
jgi:head-tail adaptor